MGNSWSTYKNDVSYNPPCLQCKLFCMNITTKNPLRYMYAHVAHKHVLSLASGLGDPKINPPSYHAIFIIGEV